ncbi:MAG: FHA domain-containing protein [Moheibacter sp.]
MIFKIGRNENNHYVIDDPTVSNFHAQIEIDEQGGWTLQDMDSANGITVNDVEVVSKKIQLTDQIQLGKFVISNNELHAKIKEFKRNNQLDFTQEFNVVKEYYDEYNKKASKLKNTYKIKPLLIRSGVTLGMIAVIFFLPKELIDPTLRSTLMVTTGVLGGILATFTVNDTKLKNQLDILYAQYAKIIRCPKCEHELINKSWIFWKERGGCPKCNCSWDK